MRTIGSVNEIIQREKSRQLNPASSPYQFATQAGILAELVEIRVLLRVLVEGMLAAADERAGE